MEPTDARPAHDPGGTPSRVAEAEFIVRNGRLRGARTPIDLPVTLIGRMEHCDIRLNVDGISPLQCVLVQAPQGYFLRDLEAEGNTRVNDRPVAIHLLHDGDLVSVGPFEFEFRGPAPGCEAIPEREIWYRQEQDALRVQTAAVVAQQAALGEEEGRIAQERTALRQQDAQLVAHLEEKQLRLKELQGQVQEDRAALRAERANHEAHVEETARELGRARQEAEEVRRQAQAERQRLVDLRRRLKRRWHRHWFAERKAMQRREADLAGRLRQLERDRDGLRRERETLDRLRQRFHGEAEIGRRQLQAVADELRKQRDHLEREGQQARESADARRHALDQRELALTDAERNLARQRQHWESAQRGRAREAEGLECRIQSFRRILKELEERLKHSSGPVGCGPTPPPGAPEAGLVAPAAEPPGHHEDPERVAALEDLVRDLADQRLLLAEQLQQLVAARQQLHLEQSDAAAELEALALDLDDRERTLEARASALQPALERLEQRQDQVARREQQLLTQESRHAVRTVLWEAERDRLMVEVSGREDALGEQIRAVEELHQGWARDRREQTEWFQAERSVIEELHRQWVSLCREWSQRGVALDAQQRSVAERALALEQLRQEILRQTSKPAAAERRLRKLRRKLTGLSADAVRTLRRERKTLENRLSWLDHRFRELEQYRQAVAGREAEFLHRQADWQKERVLAQNEQARWRQQVATLQALRQRYEQQVTELQGEVERLAQVLLDEAPSEVPASAQAA